MGSPRKWVIIFPLAIGLAAFILMKQTGQPPQRATPEEQVTPVHVITTPSVTVLPKAIGQGSVKPGKTWSAIAQIKGTITEKHPKLNKGAILEGGSLILQIDPTDYHLAIAQTEADIKGIQAQLEELNAKASNTRASLAIEQSALELNQKELQRKRKLVNKGSVSHSDLESQERSLLAQQQSVQNQHNTLNLIPSQKAVLQAELARKQVALTSAKRDLANAQIRLPYTSRISSVQVEQEQYVREGELLVTADGLDNAEIEIPLTIRELSALVHSDQPIDIANRTNSDTSPPLVGLQARVSLLEPGMNTEWPARFARLSDSLDSKTRTVGVIVEVDKPYGNIQPGIKPPLVKGLFVQVTLTGKAKPNSIIVPRSALHGHNIYIATDENRLEIRPVTVTMLQPDFAVIASGLQAGERVVTSDLLPAIEGMLLEPQEDQKSLKQIVASATGETP